jgi:hypothetical protein
LNFNINISPGVILSIIVEVEEEEEEQQHSSAVQRQCDRYRGTGQQPS